MAKMAFHLPWQGVDGRGEHPQKEMTSTRIALHPCRDEAPKSVCPQQGQTRTAEPGLRSLLLCLVDSPPCIHSQCRGMPVKYHFHLSISCIKDEDTAHIITCSNQENSFQTQANPGFSMLVRISWWATMKQSLNLLEEIFSTRVKRKRGKKKDTP